MFKVSQTCYRYTAQIQEQNVIIADWLSEPSQNNGQHVPLKIT